MAMFGTATFRRTAVNGQAGTRSLGKPAASFPGAIANDAHLAIGVDRLQTTLASPLSNTATVMTVVDASAIVANVLLSIDNEIVQVTSVSGTQVTITRGFDGTTPALHLGSAPVSGFVDAYHHNTLVAEVEAIENALGPNLSRVPTSPFVISRAFDFPAQTPGGALTAGTNSILLAPVPQGVNGTDTDHYVYISGGTGAAEAVKITGGTAVAGAASGTIFVTCANAHTGAWTVTSASAGIQEAIVSTGTTGAAIYIPAGISNVYALTSVYQPMSFIGAGPDVTFVNNNSTTTGVFKFQLTGMPRITGPTSLAHMTICAGGINSNSINGSNSSAVLVNGVGNTGSGTNFSDLIIKNHNINLDIQGGSNIWIHQFQLLYQKLYGLRINGTGVFVSDGIISNSQGSGLPATATGAGILWALGSGIHVRSVDITAMPFGVLIQTLATGGIFGGFFTNVLADTSNQDGWRIDSTGGQISQLQFVDCWASYNGCYTPATLPAGITAAQTTITVTPSASQPYPASGTLTIDSEQMDYSAYDGVNTFSGITRAAHGTTATTHASGTNVFVSGFPAHGFSIVDSKTFAISITGGIFGANGGHGLNIGAGSDISIVNVIAQQNSQYITGLGNGITIGANVSSWAVRSSLIGNFGSIQTNRQGVGVSVGTGSSDNWQITGNQFYGGGIPVYDTSTGNHKIISNNTGVDDAPPPILASAANVTLGQIPNPVFYLTGTTTVLSLTPAWIGRQIRLIKTDAGSLTVGGGGNIPGTHTLTQNLALTLTFDGTNWY